MRRNRLLLSFVFVFLLVSLISVSVFADDNVPTKQKIIVNYNEKSELLELEYYIASGSAIVGYCNFDYDSSILSLVDKNGNVVPDSVPKHSNDGSSASYLSDVVSCYNNTVVTDVGKGADKLINTKDGYIFYAWILPSDYPFVDASSGDALLSKISFKIKDGFTAADLTEDCVKVATKEITNNVSGWYAGLVVMNKSQKRSTYSGEGQNKALFEAIYNLPENTEVTPPVQDENTDEDTSSDNKTEDDDLVDEEQNNPEENTPVVDSNKTDNNKTNDDELTNDDEQTVKDELPSEDDVVEEETPAVDENVSDSKTEDDNLTQEEDGNKVDENASEENEETSTTDEPVADQETSNEENSDEETKDEPDTTEEIEPDLPNENPEPVVINPAVCAKTMDFGITISKDSDSLRVKWTCPESLENVSSYTLIITDTNFIPVRKISGISGLSSSYTASGLMSGFDYKVYLLSHSGDSFVTSRVFDAKTNTPEKHPETVVANVFYEEGNGYMFGLSSELVLFGDKPTKVPEIIPQDGMYFLGWTIDGTTLINPKNTKIYSDTMFSAVYSEAKPLTTKSFINGYEDGTFKPKGNITRAEAATIISRLCDDYDDSKRYVHNFSDCEKGLWYEKPVAYCQSKGYITGYEDGTFRPYGKITRAEFATILLRVFGFDETIGVNVFSDLDGHWGKNNICVLFSAGITKPDSKGYFRPDQMLTREDAVAMINRCLGTIPNEEAILEQVKNNGYRFTDVPQYSEYFYDIMASVSTNK